jgi:O-antigen/teichoic acid export membrane protein
MGAVAAYFFFDAAMTLLALQRGSDIKQIFAVIAIVPALIFVNNICGTQVVLGLGHARLFRNVVLVSGLALVAWSVALVMAWGVQGAAWALLLGEIGICAGMVWASLKVVRYPWIWR